MNIENYEKSATNFVVKFLESNDLNYVDVVQKLKVLGIEEKNTNLSNKIQRGKFQFALILQLLDATGKELLIVNKKCNKRGKLWQSYLKH